MSAIVWFSGVSGTNLWDVVPHHHHVEYACNHFNEFRSVDHIIAYDRQIIAQTQPDASIEYWTQPKWASQTWQAVPHHTPTTQISDSGQLAIHLAHTHDHHTIYVIGCDWGVTDRSVQDQFYGFRGWQPPKYTPTKQRWLDTCQYVNKIVWVHLERQPFMRRFLHHDDFLDLITSSHH